MTRISSVSRLSAVSTIAIALLLVGASVALAVTAVHKYGGAVKAVITTIDPNTETATGTTPTKFGNLSTSIAVPANTHALLLITLSATGSCTDVSAGNTCRVAVFVDNSATSPANAVWGQSNGGAGLLSAQSFQFVIGPVAAGSHTISVAGYGDGATTQIKLLTPNLTILRAPD